MGFACKVCQASTFTLKVQPEVEQQLHITTNEFEDVLITVGNNPPFQADLGFMNRFASCSGCGAIKQWQYRAVVRSVPLATAISSTPVKTTAKKHQASSMPLASS